MSKENIATVTALFGSIVAMLVGIIGMRSGYKEAEKLDKLYSLTVEYKDGTKAKIEFDSKDINREAAARLVAALSDERLRSVTIGSLEEPFVETSSAKEEK